MCTVKPIEVKRKWTPGSAEATKRCAIDPFRPFPPNVGGQFLVKEVPPSPVTQVAVR